MNRKATIIVGTASLALLLLILAPLCYVRWTRCDATIHAPGFSEVKFHQIAKGMTKAEVEHLLGKPLKNREGRVEGCPEDGNTWCYAWFDCAKIPDDDRVCNTWFQTREVDFDRRGRVKAVLSSTEQFG